MNDLIHFFSVFNNREQALILWAVSFLIVSLVSKRLRISILRVIYAFFKIRIVGVLFFAWCYSSLFIYIFYKLELWNSSMLKETLIWLVFTSFLLVLKATIASDKEKYFNELFFESVKLIILIEFLANLFPFSLVTELILLPVFTFLYLMKLMAEQKEEHLIVAKFLNGTFILVGSISIFIYCWKAITDLKNVVSYQNLLDLVFPIWITILFIPYIFLVIVYINYESLFKWLDYRLSENDKLLIRYLKYKTIVTVRFKYKKLELVRKYANNLNTISKEEIDKKIISKL